MDFQEVFKPFRGMFVEVSEQMKRVLSCKMRRFYLIRKEDVDPDQTSGTGVIAEGVVFADGKVALRWTTTHKSSTIYDSIDDVLAIHGHGGKTVLLYLDPESKQA